MKLDATILRYLSNGDFAVLHAVEKGMQNHEWISVPLVAALSSTPRGVARGHLMTLLKHKLVAHNGQNYDGFKLTYLGLDFLALRKFVKRGLLSGVGTRIGVGKESDIHICKSPEGSIYCLKLHRLGRVSFKTVKQNRDYLQRRQHASWMYLARLAAAKEFAYMKALYDKRFPVPVPIDINRHAILMSYVDASPLCHVRALAHPDKVAECLMRLIVRFAKCGLIHGDFNEFNLMIGDDESIIVIDFPQIVSTSHVNAKEYFDRDVACVRDFFEKRCRLILTEYPQFEEAIRKTAAAAHSQSMQGAAPPTSGRTSVVELEEDVVIDEREVLGDVLKETAGQADIELMNLALEARDLPVANVHPQVITVGGEGEAKLEANVVKDGGGGEAADGVGVSDGDDDGGDNKSDGNDDDSDDDGDDEVEAGEGGEVKDVWRPRLRRPNTQKVRQKARRKQHHTTGGGAGSNRGNATKGKDRATRQTRYQMGTEC